MILMIELLRILGFMRGDAALVPFNERSEAVKTYQVWACAEILIRIGLICSSLIFMLCRKFAREKYVFYNMTIKEIELQTEGISA